MMISRLIRIILLPSSSLLWGASLSADDGVSAVEAAVPFERTARRVFKTHCFHCHGEEGVVKGGLDLRLRHLIVAGGDSGPAVRPHEVENSYLLTRMIRGKMPPHEVTVRPTAAEIDIVRRWIAAGATTARPEPDDPADLPQILPEDRAYWAFQPIASPQPPDVVAPDWAADFITPIDAFIIRTLQQQGRTLSDEADKRTLIRRASFDLIGLPPTPEEVDAFVGDESPDAWERLIDRLIDSPSYGERWGRHWLDVVGYADSEGFTESDVVRNYAYKYRDYVIDAFNNNMPFDQFIQEQLAGDELVTSSMDSLSDEDKRRLIATGFLRMAPDGTGSGADDLQAAANAVMTETINIVSTSLLGMSVGCAQCHDHRFDPILQDDFYRLRAVFEPALNPKDWKTPNQRRIPLVAGHVREKTAEIEARVDAAVAAHKAKEDAWRAKVFERELSKIPEHLRSEARNAFDVSIGERTPSQRKLFVDYPNLRVGRGSALDLYLELFEEGRKAKEELAKLKGEIAKVRAELPKTDYIRGISEPAENLPETFIFHRGDPAQPTQRVGPGGLTVLNHLMPVDFAKKAADLDTSGRRLGLARFLTHPDNPLTGRVLVNRFWMHHFGRPLVATPGDFGLQGEPPTHPRLLDWLARDFIDHGWDLKRLHKSIMMSAVYRQSSQRNDLEFDPDNELYGRHSVRRLEAETIRDSILLVSGTLSYDGAGPAETVQETSEGQTIINADVDATEDSRRSVYVQTRRSTPLAMLEVFDAPRLEPNCTIRNVSTVTPQSLMLMNSKMIVEQSKAFASRVAEEAGDDRTRQIERAWEIAYSASPNERELTAAIEFLQQQAEYFEAKEVESAPKRALESLCMVLMGSNRFLYVD